MLEFLESVRQRFLKEDMRVIKSDTDFSQFEKIFGQLIGLHSSVVVWQITPKDKSRQQSRALIKSLDSQESVLQLDLLDKETFSEQLVLFGYAKGVPMIFKSEIIEITDKGLSIALPTELKLMEAPDITVVSGAVRNELSTVWKSKRMGSSVDNLGSDIMRVKSMAQRSSRDQELLNNEFNLSLDEEDKLFADKRESPRARPKADKWVKVAMVQGNGPQVFKLFDLSRGGLGFVSQDEFSFSKGSEIHIVGFNDFDLDDPLVGNVMSIRPIDGTTEFKVGIKFSEGQD